ncbi:hypothetical protein J809_3309 [Acinetobacter sp. 25977_6]|nr:hypothetical protein J811_3038 [Acinetobacter sp. 25977_8]EXT41700.1 hypothetical protein J810_3234 [Acinetobacter sp. 25977_7]EXT42021.1 hypothetical protein J809_3309 [Acinetobacter sp. 25977_6]EXT48332.1 hypothetical protein J807_3375 [Acinetobacter sp. 25977_4]EXT52305.1 hypothetical protein J806_3474 [Acinetobacter sp. 25977_3]EXT54496.1 hypothetical protein J805_3394 [Acinetobacter sp. 25977_2]EXT59143.1 hypothetical protein J804_3525 [Acinetobacter sp. 25977_1]EXT67669.1 hypothetic
MANNENMRWLAVIDRIKLAEGVLNIQVFHFVRGGPTCLNN